MLAVATEFQDVPLRDAHVLQQHPWRVRDARRFAAAQLRWNASDGQVELNVGTPTSEQINQVLAKRMTFDVSCITSLRSDNRSALSYGAAGPTSVVFLP